MRFSKPIFALLLVVMAASALASTDYTQKDYYREILAANRAEMGQAFPAAGRHNPKWDAAATSALNTFAIYDAQRCEEGVAAILMCPDPVIGATQLGSEAQKAIDLGCDDPLVLYARALSLIEIGKTHEARDYLTQAVTSLKGTSYSPLRQCRVINRLGNLCGDEKVKEHLWPQVETLCVELASGKFLNGASQREAAKTVLSVMRSAEKDQAESLIHELTSHPKVNAWILNDVLAEYHMDVGWKARGGDLASRTTDEQMRGFEKHFSLARDAAQKTYDLQPAFPESAVEMTTIAMGVGTPDDAVIWFNRAKDAEADFAPAYTAVFWAMQPRWGGTTAKTMEIGTDAANTKRYDTSIPWEYIFAALSVAADDLGGDKNAFKDATVQQTSANIVNEYMKQQKEPYLIDYFKACLAALHVANKEMVPAKQLLDQIQGDPDPSAFRLFNLWAPQAIENVYLSSIPTGEGLARFRGAITRHNYKNAEKFLDEVITRDRSAHRTLEILQRLKDGTQVMQKYAANEPVSLIDEPALGMWSNEITYDIDASGITTRGLSGLSMESRFPLQDRHYTIHFAFEFDEVGATRGQTVNLAWGLDQTSVGWSIYINGQPPMVTAQAPGPRTEHKHKEFPIPIPAKNEIDITYWDGIPTVKFNGTRMMMDFGDPKVLEDLKPANRLSLSTNAAIHISAFTLQHLTTKP